MFFGRDGINCHCDVIMDLNVLGLISHYHCKCLSLLFSSKIPFFDHFNNILKECNFIKEVILLGDFNINWDDKCNRSAFKVFTNKFDMTQLIKGPTRITQTKETQT